MENARKRLKMNREIIANASMDAEGRAITAT
jgi:hypothetical protein